MNRKTILCGTALALFLAGCSGTAGIYPAFSGYEESYSPPEKDVVYSREHAALRRVFQQKLNTARNLMWQGKYAEAEQAFLSLMNDATNEKVCRNQVPVNIIRNLEMQKKFADIPPRADELLMLDFIAADTRSALLQQKANAYFRMGNDDAGLRVLYERLKIGVAPEDAFRTKVFIIRKMCGMKLYDDAALRLEELLDDAEKQTQEITALNLRRELYALQNNVEKRLEASEEVLELLKKDEEASAQIYLTDAAFLCGQEHQRLKEKGADLYKKVIYNEKLSAITRVSAFNELYNAGTDSSGFYMIEMGKIANETIFQIPKLPPPLFEEVTLKLMLYNPDKEMSAQYAKALLKYPGITNLGKIAAHKAMAMYYTFKNEEAKAETEIKKPLAFLEMSNADRIQAYKNVAWFYGCRKCFDDAEAVLRAGIWDAETRTALLNYAVSLYESNGISAKAEAIRKELKTPFKPAPEEPVKIDNPFRETPAK